MRPRIVALGLAVAVLAGCGSEATKQRRGSVNAYLEDVRVAQANLVSRQARIDDALARFSLQRSTEAERRKLRSARAAVEATRRRVSALAEPRDAKKLDALLLRRLALQRDLFDELLRTDADARRLIAVSPNLTAAAKRLRLELAKRGNLAQYGAAFGRYGDALRPIAPRIAPATGTSLLGPTLAAQHSALVRSVALCDRIRNDLRRNRVQKANAAVHSLLQIAATLNGAATQRGETQAARAYNAKIAQLVTLERRIEQERARLVRAVG
jgi:hypothetical protein